MPTTLPSRDPSRASSEGPDPDLARLATWTPARLALHHLAPGVATLTLFVPLALLLPPRVPGMVALFVAILLGEVPLSWILMRRGVRREGLPFSPVALFPWTRWPPPVVLIAVGLLLALFGMVVVFGVAGALEPTLRSAFFGWVPQALVLEAGPEALMGSSREGLLALWVLSGVVGVGIGGATQELYHRGFLLPRSVRMGSRAVVFNAGMFAMTHLTAPWGWPFFFIGALPWAAATWRFRSVQLGLIGHLGMLLLGWLAMTGIVFGWIPAPAAP